jgi:acetylornithine aminotransferase
LEVIEGEDLLRLAYDNGEFVKEQLSTINGIKEIRGKGLMIGLDLEVEAAPIRADLIKQYRMFTGSSAGKHTIRLLPPLNIQIKDLTLFLESLQKSLALTKV